MSRVVLLGADGMLGLTFRRRFADEGRDVVPLTRRELDVTRPEEIARVLGDAPSLLLNCTAYTDVDGAETNETLANAVNGDAVAHLAAHAQKTGSTLVCYSTDYVFDGTATTPYRVDEPRAPLNAYGRSKARGEEALEASGAAWLNLRTSWLYAPWSKNFVRTIAQAAKSRPSLRVVNDQRGRPTSTSSLVQITLGLLDEGVRGTFHATDAGECTWFDLARAVAAHVSPSTVVEPCSSAEFPRPAPRPAYSVLDTTRTEAVLGRPLVPYEDALRPVLDALESP